MQRLFCVFVFVVLTGCQTTKNATVDSAPELESLPVAQPQAALPKVPLSEELLTQLLTAEIAVRQGQYERAVDQLLDSAQSSRDPRLAAKAAYWSLQGGFFKKAQQAAQLWLDVLDAEPQENLADPRIVLATSLIELKQPDQALPVLSQAIAGSTNQDIYKRIAGELSRLKNSAGVVGIYENLIENTDDPENAYLGLAILSARLNDFELSGKAIDKVLDANPGNEDAGLIKISYLYEGGDDKQVLDFAENFLKKNKQAYQFRMEFARYLTSNAKPLEAIQQFEVVAANDEQQFQEARLNIVALAMEEENYKLADENLAILLDTDPANNRLVFFRCQVQRELGNYADALELCNEISLGEFYFPAQLELANIMVDDEKIEAAMTHLDSVPVSGSDEQVQIYLRKQQLLYQADQVQRSVTILNSGLIKYPENISLLYARGLLLSELGQVPEHERDMRKLIKLDPDNAHAYNALGYTLADLTTRYDEALELIQKAVELNPDDAYILDSLGWVYFKLNDLEQARVHLEQAFDLSGDAEIAAHLGELYWTLGDKSKAKSVWQGALKDKPDNKVLNKTLERYL